ncbi:AraC family transcriptional regulator [Salinibius halmophilus]|uniref:AraC family transcriptional regulator n=1 Tax=Salinibius halmophilus TaxID=1853216 RepID=UPI00131401A0|nr:AraC family transcriptional regulator [Salinibius halmophilus]
MNDALHQIHRSLAAPLSVAELAKRSSYSSFHFQRLFKAQTGLSINQYIRQTRLEWVANLLVFHPNQTIAELADLCGFQSIASFSHSFRAYFGVTPKQWRKNQYQTHVSQADFQLSPTLRMSEPEVIQLAAQPVIYLRHQGYDQSIRQAWQQLAFWQASNKVKTGQMLSLYHSNPLLTPRTECRYVAALTVASLEKIPAGVGRMEIPGGWFLSCRAQGQYGDVLNLWQYLYYQYMPTQALRTLPIPAHGLFFQNHLSGTQTTFDLALRLPLQI